MTSTALEHIVGLAGLATGAVYVVTVAAIALERGYITRRNARYAEQRRTRRDV